MEPDQRNEVKRTARTDRWASTEQTKGKKKVAKTAHPIFEKCAEQTDDEYWKSIFLSAAVGKLPRGFMFKNDSILFKKGTKAYKIDIVENPTEMMISSINFFKRLIGIRSDRDIEEERSREERSKGADQPLTWDEITKKKSLRKRYVSEYIYRLGAKYGLVPEEKNQLMTLLYQGFHFNHIPSSSVVFRNKEIVDITDLIYDEKKREFRFLTPIAFKQKKPSRSSKAVRDDRSIKTHKKTNFYHLWLEYLGHLQTDKIGSSTINMSEMTTEEERSCGSTASSAVSTPSIR